MANGMGQGPCRLLLQGAAGPYSGATRIAPRLALVTMLA
jgi:hypothetical protein